MRHSQILLILGAIGIACGGKTKEDSSLGELISDTGGTGQAVLSTGGSGPVDPCAHCIVLGADGPVIDMGGAFGDDGCNKNILSEAVTNSVSIIGYCADYCGTEQWHWGSISFDDKGSVIEIDQELLARPEKEWLEVTGQLWPCYANLTYEYCCNVSH